jgi:hypothetical protein
MRFFIVRGIPVLLKRNCEIDKSRRAPNLYGFDTLPKLKEDIRKMDVSLF